MATLGQDKLLELHQAILSARLDGRRDALLTSIDRRVIAHLPRVPHPDAQILEDLDYLNNIGALDDGSSPLETWLKNAATLASPQKEADVFREVLDTVFGSDSPHHVLVVRGGKSDGIQIYLREGTEHIVGRGRRANVAFPEDHTLSSAHARISVQNHSLRVKDLDSMNGVWLNGRRVAEARLSTGDVLRCGQTVLVVTEVTTPMTVPTHNDSRPLLYFTI